jgi:hypothetical protein
MDHPKSIMGLLIIHLREWPTIEQCPPKLLKHCQCIPSPTKRQKRSYNLFNKAKIPL